MRRSMLVFILVIGLVISGGNAYALSLFFDPNSTTASVGDTLNFNLWIGDIPGGRDLTSFDIDIIFETQFLSYSSYSLGTGLGVVGSDPFFNATDLSNPFTSPGVVNIAENAAVFFDASTQDSSFILAGLNFSVIEEIIDVTTLDFGYTFLGDFSGELMNLELQTATVAPVPEPGTIILLGTGLVGLTGWARRRKMKKDPA